MYKYAILIDSETMLQTLIQDTKDISKHLKLIRPQLKPTLINLIDLAKITNKSMQNNK